MSRRHLNDDAESQNAPIEFHEINPKTLFPCSLTMKTTDERELWTRLTVAVVVSFFICWVPFHAQRLLASYLVKNENENQNQLLLDIYLKLTYISGVMYYLSSTINPLLYQLMSAKFRLAFKETFKCSLFKCAIFRRSSSTATQPTAIGLNHSPTNSVRNTELSHSQLACPCQLSSARARFICDSGGRATGGQKQQLASSQTDLQQAAATDQPLNKHEQQQQPVQEAPGGGGCSCCCCSGCQTHAGEPHQHPWAPLATSVLGRFRGQLNASLTSLFKFSLSDERPMKAGEPPANCSCCLTSSPSLATPKRVLGDETSQKTAQPSGDKRREPADLLRRSETTLVADDMEKCGQEVADFGQSEEQMRTTLSQLQSASALGGQRQGGRHQVKSACETVRSETSNDNNLKAASLQTNFPSHHTMLKFVRSPTPSSLACGQPLTSLTRLSSRDDDDDDDDDVEKTTEMLNKQHLKVANVNSNCCDPLPAGNNSMDALIRATKQEDDCIGHDESDPLISTTLTTSVSSSNEASRTQSSVGSSPDQLGSTSQSTTNQARTLSNSSSRSSLAQLTSQNRDLRTSNAPIAPSPRVMGALSGVKSTKQKLIGSKSSAAETSASGGSQQRCRGHQLQRRPSWRLDQMIDSDHQCEPTGRTNAELVGNTLNNNRVLIETQIIDQNGNERNESELIDRDCWPIPSSLSSSETKLNSNGRKKTSQREPNKPTTKSSLSDDEDKPPSFSINDSGSHSLDSNPTTRGDVANDQFEQDENLATAFMDLGPIGV